MPAGLCQIELKAPCTIVAEEYLPQHFPRLNPSRGKDEAPAGVLIARIGAACMASVDCQPNVQAPQGTEAADSSALQGDKQRKLASLGKGLTLAVALEGVSGHRYSDIQCYPASVDLYRRTLRKPNQKRPEALPKPPTFLPPRFLLRFRGAVNA